MTKHVMYFALLHKVYMYFPHIYIIPMLKYIPGSYIVIYQVCGQICLNVSRYRDSYLANARKRYGDGSVI